MRAAIYGAGSLGTILGAYIARAGGSIELINRNRAHVEALQKNGATVTGTVNFTQPVIAYTPEEMSGKYDVVFLMTKQQHNAEVVDGIKDFLADDGALRLGLSLVGRCYEPRRDDGFDSIFETYGHRVD